MNKNLLKNVGILVGMTAVVVLLLIFATNQFLGSYTRNGEKIPVPHLYGLTLNEAVGVLDELGLRYEIRDSVFDTNIPKNAILHHDPDTGEFVKNGRIIYLSINASEVPRVKMPDLDHKNINQAIMIIESLGLLVGKIDTANDIADDAVLEQLHKGKRILPDTEIPKGSIIDLVIGDGMNANVSYEGEVDIPDLVGTTLVEATIILEAYGLTLGTVVGRGAITDSANATIRSQVPSYAPEAKIRSGSRVSVIIKQ